MILKEKNWMFLLKIGNIVKIKHVQWSSANLVINCYFSLIRNRRFMQSGWQRKKKNRGFLT